MKKVILFSVVISLVAGFSSCITTLPVYRSSTIRVTDIQTLPITCDLQIDQAKKTGMASTTAGGSIEDLKISAIADVLEKNAGDVLIEPHFVIEEKGMTITVTVSGYVGKYSNIRPDSKSQINSVSVLHPGIPAQTTPTSKKGLLGLGLFGL